VMLVGHLVSGHRAREDAHIRIADYVADFRRQEFGEIKPPEQRVGIEQIPHRSPEYLPSQASSSSSSSGWSNRSGGRLPRRCAKRPGTRGFFSTGATLATGFPSRMIVNSLPASTAC